MTARENIMARIRAANRRHAEPSVEDIVVYLLRFNLGTQPHEDRVQTLVRFAKDNGGVIDKPMLLGLLSLIAAMPEYQLC